MKKLRDAIREASCEPKPVLFIDEIHLLLGAGFGGPGVRRGEVSDSHATSERQGGKEGEEAIAQRAQEATRHSLRPELVNRLTK
jgi:ATP-dependent Clp protease ATP-binding subunit ClpA